MKNQYNWKGLEFPTLIKKIHKFEKKNPCRAVHMLFNKKKSQYTCMACMSRHKVNCKNQVNSLMMEDGEKRHYSGKKYI